MGELTTKMHELKVWSEFYKALATGEKNFEVRLNDRGFTIGDTLVLMEWDNQKCEYTGSLVVKKVTYILHGGQFGIEKGYCVLSIK